MNDCDFEKLDPRTPRRWAIDAATAVPGQTWPSELRWLYDAFRASRAHVEVGVFCGRSLFAACAGMADGARVWAVDDDSAGGADMSSYREPRVGWTRDVRRATLRAIRERNPTLQVEELPADSVDAARAVAATGTLLDSVFLDGSHGYHRIVADIEIWRPLLAEGGLLCGHDYGAAHPGVMDAVNELVAGFEVAAGTRIWWQRIPPRAALAECGARSAESRTPAAA